MTDQIKNLRSQQDKFFELMTRPTDNGHSIKEQVPKQPKIHIFIFYNSAIYYLGCHRELHKIRVSRVSTKIQ